MSPRRDPRPRPQLSQIDRFGLIGLAVLTLAAAPAWANAGSPAALATAAHLVIGNLIIGVVEAVTVMRLGGRGRAVWLLIIANYASAWAGVLVAGPLFEWLSVAIGGNILEYVRPATWLTMGILIAAGAVAELPLFAACFDRNRRTWRRVAGAALAANAITGVAVVGWYALVTDHSLPRSFRYAETPAVVADDHSGEVPWVYYLSPDQSELWRVRLGAGESKLVRSLVDVAETIELEAVPNADGAIDLVLTALHWGNPLGVIASNDSGFGPVTDHTLRPSGRQCLVVVPDAGAIGSIIPEGRPANFGEASDLRPASEQSPDVRFGYFTGIQFGAIDGWGTSNRLGLRSALIGTPVPSVVTVLPGDLLVFEISWFHHRRPQGIYVASLRSRTISKLVDGVSPVVVYED